jgi:potassium-transporting ATPase KdpC subunit
VKQQLKIAFWMTIVTAALCGVLYPVVVAALARALFPAQANGELIERGGKLVGSRLIGQPFSSPGYFHSRPSAAGNGYDALRSGGSNLGPTNRLLIERVKAEVRALRAENPAAPVPVDLATASGSGLDPDISPAAAEFQVPRVARERGMSEAEVRALVRRRTEGRQFGILGEPCVNVLELNLDLEAARPLGQSRGALAGGRRSWGNWKR